MEYAHVALTLTHSCCKDTNVPGYSGAEHMFGGNLNTQRYRDEILAPVVIPYVNANPNAIFQQDNARPHTARLTTQYLQANNVDVME